MLLLSTANVADVYEVLSGSFLPPWLVRACFPIPGILLPFPNSLSPSHFPSQDFASAITCSEMFGKLLATSTSPPFLFRAASHLSQGVKLAERDTKQLRKIKDTVSRGINTTELIDPLDGYGVDYYEDLAEIESIGIMQHMLKNHISYENRVASEFSSWSVSLLYVLVHAMRKSYNESNGILIYVMDTNKLPESSKIFTARDLLRKHGLHKVPTLMDYALGLYMAVLGGTGWLTVTHRRVLDPWKAHQHGWLVEGSTVRDIDTQRSLEFVP